jgi:phage I-like protein
MPESFQVSAQNAIQAGTTAPGWVMWMPAGEHEIRATKNGKPSKLTVTVTEADAAKLQAALATLKASGGPEPYVGFDHNDGPAGFWAEEFAWKSGEKPGIYLKARWTPRGKSAVTAGDGESADYRYFSPTFMADDAGNITGLPASGEIGSLVNNPAFRQIAAVAASESSPSNRMTDAEIQALQAENTRLKGEKDTLAADLKKQKENNAAAAVSAAVDAGKIAAQDTDEQNFWKASHLEKPEETRKRLDNLPVRFAIKAAQIGGQEPAGSGEPREVNGAVIRARAQDLLNAARSQGRCISWQQAWIAAEAEAGALPSTAKVTAA